MRQVFWAVQDNEVIQCHLIAKKDRYDGRKYAANSKDYEGKTAGEITEAAFKAGAEFVAGQYRKVMSKKDII